MHQLIQALQIFEIYNPKFETHCEHDVLSVCGVSQEEVSLEHVKLLDDLGFLWGEGGDNWISFRWGSC